ERLACLDATIWDRRLTDAEMSGIYDVASLIWACYDPCYDQASGIFGRSVQRQRMVVLRKGAMIVRFAAILGHPNLALPYDPQAAAEILTNAQIVQVPKSPGLVERRAHSIATVRAAL